MKKILLALGLIICMATVSWGADGEWRNSSGENTILGSTAPSDIDFSSYQHIVLPLDRLLSKYKRAANLKYNSVSSIDITAGEISCQNTATTITRMRQNTSTLTLTWADLDTGVEANATYYVYGVADADSTGFTGVISINSSTPDAGAATYYKLLGSFENVAGDIVDSSLTAPAEEKDIAIEIVYDYGASASSSTIKTTGVLIAYGTTGTLTWGTCSTISNLPFSSSSTYRAVASSASGNSSQNFCSISSQTSTTVQVCVASVPAGTNINASCNWIAVGY